MKGAPVNRGRVLPALELALVGLVLLWSHLRLDVPAEKIPDYGRPDALFYTIGGENLARGLGYRVIVDGRAIPPKFPPGTSMLLAPWYFLTGKGRASGVSVIQALAHILALSVWFLARRRAGPLGGLAALLALEAGLCFAAFRNQAVSEVPAALLLLCVLALATGSRPGRKRLILAGIFAGFGVWVRYPLAAFLPAPLFALEPWNKEGRSKGLLLAAGAALPIILLLAWQAHTFGSPFRTGYSLWLPGYHQGGRPLFSTAYAFHAPAEGMPGEANLLYYPMLLAGKGCLLLPWPQALAVLAGILLLFGPGRKDLSRTGIFTLLGAFSFLALYGFYFYQEARLLAPLAPLMAVLGAQGARELGKRIGGDRPPSARKILRRLPLVLLLAGNGWFFWRLTTTIPLESIRIDKETRHAALLKKAVPPGAVLVTGRDILFLSHELPGRTILPMSARQDWVEALLFMDWKKKAPPGSTFREFREWESRLPSLPPMGEPGRGFLLLPAPAALPYLRKEIRRGRPVFIDPAPPGRLPPWAAPFHPKKEGPLYRAESLR